MKIFANPSSIGGEGRKMNGRHVRKSVLTMRRFAFGLLFMAYGVEIAEGWIAKPLSHMSSVHRSNFFRYSSLQEAGTRCKGANAEFSSPPLIASSSALFATCRICRKPYDPLSNDAFSCVYHPGSLRGESPRKSDWEDERYDQDGKRKREAETETSIDNSKLVYTYTCCGGESDSEGCTLGKCKSFDDP